MKFSDHRKNKFLNIGRNKGFVTQLDDLKYLKHERKYRLIFLSINFLNLKLKYSNFTYLYYNNYTGLFNLIFIIKHHNIFYIFFLTHKNKVHFCSFFSPHIFGSIFVGLIGNLSFLNRLLYNLLNSLIP